MAIRIDPDVMVRRAAQYRSEGRSIGQVLSNLDNLLRCLSTEWEGTASRSYEELYLSELKPNLRKTQATIDEIANALEKVAQEAHERDNALASTLRSQP